MSNIDEQCLDSFPEWLKTLADDALRLVDVASADPLPDEARRIVLSSLNYLLKSLDLIPDGIADLGFMDDAFVFRVAAERAARARDAQPDPKDSLSHLADQAQLIRQFMGDDYARLERYVGSLESVTARGRAVDELMERREQFDELRNELRAWASGYECPGFGRDEKNLVKLRSFLATKLPA